MRILLLLLLVPVTALAEIRRAVSIPPYRKLGQPYSIGQQKTMPSTRPSARVVTQNFKEVTRSLGEWSGTVHGNGNVHLSLQILRRGKLESKRYIGNVPLKDKSTTFHFRSPLPVGRDWTWNIVAFLT